MRQYKLDATLEVIGDSEIGVEIVPGITAASAAAALLGAPLSNDFAVVSLSDLLVPWPEIEKRLEGLAMMGIAVAIYNPKSKTRYKENVKCFVNNPKTMEIAVKEDITRTAAGFRTAKELIRDNIVVVGNAPSTCLELSALINGGIKPALIIATPVGFVNAADVKEVVLSTGIPCIVIRGPRGGTPSAVAIINAIIELSMEEERGRN